MTDAQDHEDAMSRVCKYLYLNDKAIHPMVVQLSSLPTSTLNDAADMLDHTKWDVDSLDFDEVLLSPNAEYGIELFKRLTAIHNDFLNPFMLKEHLIRTNGIDRLTVEDVTDEHVTWAAVSLLVVGKMSGMLEDADIGPLREPVERLRMFTFLHPEQEQDVFRIIRERRVYDIETIQMLLLGGSAVREGML